VEDSAAALHGTNNASNKSQLYHIFEQFLLERSQSQAVLSRKSQDQQVDQAASGLDKGVSP
jgi:hypothetical protein